MATILLIDDELDAVRTRRLLLESEGHRVLQASTGPEGLELFRTEPVDLVIVDYWMSGMNGISVASQIRAMKRSVPIIVLSGYAELPGEAVGIADRWIMKGHAAEDLLRAVRMLTHS